MHQAQQQIELIRRHHRRLLPRTVPQPQGWQLAVHHEDGQRPGGDFYDFLTLPDRRVVFLLTDAHMSIGPATVLTAIIRATMHSCPLNSGEERLPFCPMRDTVVQSPHIILGNLNRILVENSLERQGVSVFCGVLSPREGTLSFANAGYPPPLLWDAASRTIEPLYYGSSLPLGLGDNSYYHRHHCKLATGDLLVWVSDGVLEARNCVDVTFSAVRMANAVAECASMGVEAVKDGLLARLRDHLGGEPPLDDVTILAMERLTEGSV
jgi:sigma-B regulation protein RsbU (phosphoserine phosphatase)